MKPRAVVLMTDGVNCDGETAHAFEKAGAHSEIVHVNQFREKIRRLAEYQILALPGGFSYGDDVASGKVLAVELISFLKDELQAFVDRGNLVIGICNGFQVLIRTGLLPFGTLGHMHTTLAHNDSGRFDCRWIKVKGERTACVFTEGLEGLEIDLMVAHGEGKVFADETTFADIERQKLVPLRYSLRGEATMQHPANPNGSLHAIAGLSDPTGRIFGLMPHPERFVAWSQHPNWRRRRSTKTEKPHGLPFFENGVRFAANR